MEKCSEVYELHCLHSLWGGKWHWVAKWGICTSTKYISIFFAFIIYKYIYVLADVTSTKDLNSSNNELNRTFAILLNTQHLNESLNCFLFWKILSLPPPQLPPPQGRKERESVKITIIEELKH